MRGMTDNERQDAYLDRLSERLRGLDSKIPVPDSVKAPQLLARMQERPPLRVVHTGWKRYAGVAAAFVLIMGGVWAMNQSGALGGGVGIGAAAGGESSAAQLDMAAAQAADVPMPEVAAVPQMAVADGESAVGGAYAADYAQVRERLVQLQGEDDYYTMPQAEAFSAPVSGELYAGTEAGEAENAAEESTSYSAMAANENEGVAETGMEAGTGEAATANGTGGTAASGAGESAQSATEAGMAGLMAKSAGETADVPDGARVPTADESAGMANDAGIGGAVQPRAASMEAGAGRPWMRNNKEIIRTDNGMIYYLQTPGDISGAVVRVVNARDMSLATTLTFPEAGVISQVVATDGMLAVAYSNESFYTQPLYEKNAESAAVSSETMEVSATVLEIYDMTNAAAPRSVRTLTQQGEYIYAGVENGQAFLVTDCAVLTNARNTAAQDSAFVPSVRDTAATNEVTPLSADNVLLPEGAATDRYAVISAVKLAGAATPAQTKAVLGGAAAAHQAGNTLYVAGAFAGTGKTGILKFAAGGGLSLAAEGSVEGELAADTYQNNPNMDAWNGSLRVMTERGNLYVLDGDLRETGRQEPMLAQHSRDGLWRFMSGRMYCVVNEDNGKAQWANIYSYELSGNVEFLGSRMEIEQLQNVRELVPIGDKLLLAVGNGSDNGPLQLALFDVSEGAPRLVHIKTLGARESFSTALQNGCGIAVSGDTIALPVVLSDDEDFYNGAYVLRLTQKGIEQLGRVTDTAGMGSDDVRMGNLQANACAITDGRLVLLSNARAASWTFPALEFKKRAELK